MFSQMVTKSKDCSDIHELCLSQAEFERREKNKQAIYGGAILNRRVRADNMRCFPFSIYFNYGVVYVRSRSDVVLSCFTLFTSSPKGGGGGVLPYMGYIGMCCGIGYGF